LEGWPLAALRNERERRRPEADTEASETIETFVMSRAGYILVRIDAGFVMRAIRAERLAIAEFHAIEVTVLKIQAELARARQPALSGGDLGGRHSRRPPTLVGAASLWDDGIAGPHESRRYFDLSVVVGQAVGWWLTGKRPASAGQPVSS